MHLPIIIIAMVGTNVAIGLWLGWGFLKRRPRSRVVVGVHLIIGLSMLEVLAVMLKKATDSGNAGALPLAQIASALLAAALLTGFAGPVLSQSKPGVKAPMLAAHAAAALSAFGVVLAWAARV
jgi:hypothetical protein